MDFQATHVARWRATSMDDELFLMAVMRLACGHYAWIFTASKRFPFGAATVDATTFLGSQTEIDTEDEAVRLAQAAMSTFGGGTMDHFVRVPV